MTVHNATTDPDLLTTLKQMLSSSAGTDIATGLCVLSSSA